MGWLVTLVSRDDPGAARAYERARPPAASREPLDPRVAVDLLYQHHARAVLAYLASRLPTLADAEDALADVFLKALRLCAEGDAPGAGWLFTVARRATADYYRERSRHAVGRTASMEAAAEAPGDEHAEPERAALRDEEQRELRALLARLPDDQRDALALRFAGGLRSAEIAAILGKSDEATRALLSRAVRRLREEWAR
jgi:RNA polymerase sigma-70 factor (ECF subfamily)